MEDARCQLTRSFAAILVEETLGPANLQTRYKLETSRVQKPASAIPTTPHQRMNSKSSATVSSRLSAATRYSRRLALRAELNRISSANNTAIGSCSSAALCTFDTKCVVAASNAPF